MLHRLRLLIRTTVLGAALAAVCAQGSSSATSTELVLNLNVNNFLEVTFPSGTTIRTTTATGTVIAPGLYQIIVNNDVPDLRDSPHMFRFSGPGVNLQTDLGAGDSKTELYPLTLAPSSTYAFQDDREPGLGRIVFTTAATGTPGGVGVTPGPTATTATTSSTSSGKKSSNTGIVGSSLKPAPFRGALTATLDAKGTPSLTRNGKKVSTLRAGRYRITVTDRTRRSGFNVQQTRKLPVRLTGPSFVGTRSQTVDFRTGQWFFYTTFVGKKSYFVVVA